jgi:HPr kinase/phosphorylase
VAADPAVVRRHAACVALAGRALLIEGVSGSGKSRLAWQLLQAGAWLIGDDLIELTAAAGRLWARAPVTGKGLLEARGLGIVRLAGPGCAPLAASLELVAGPPGERLPEPAVEEILGVAIPRVRLSAEPTGAMVAALSVLLVAREA